MRSITAQISVVTLTNSNGWTFTVQVSEANGQTRHSVSLSQRDFEQMTSGKQATPQDLVRKSFEFLLERESKNQIQRQFNLPAIERFFPDYPAEIRKRL